MWVTKLLISPVKNRIFCPKTTKFSPKLAYLSIADSFGALLVDWLVVVARAVSRKTPIYFIIFNKNACQLQINTSPATYELHHSVFLVDFLSHPPSLLRISVTSGIKESSNGRTIRIRLTTTIFSGSH